MGQLKLTAPKWKSCAVVPSGQKVHGVGTLILYSGQVLIVADLLPNRSQGCDFEQGTFILVPVDLATSGLTQFMENLKNHGILKFRTCRHI